MGCNNSLPAEETFIVKHRPDSANIVDELVDEQSSLKLCVKEKLFSWSGDTFKIKKGDGSDFLEVKGVVMSMRDRMVLRDLSGNPIAVCLRKMLSLEASFYIYTLKPRVNGQQVSSESEDGKPLYSWAKVNKDMMTLPQSYSIYMATGHDEFDNGSYKGESPGIGSPKMSIKKGGQGACLVDRAVFQFDCMNCYALTVAPGIDPALMICFTAIRDELKEK